MTAREMWHQCQTDCTLAAAKTRSPLAPLEPNSPRLLTEAKGSGRPALRPQTRPIIPACFTAYYEIEPSPSAISAMCDDELASVPRPSVATPEVLSPLPFRACTMRPTSGFPPILNR